MKPVYQGLVIAALHVALVLSLGGKLLYDRHTRPRVWAETRPYDPNLPIRGRYLSMQLITATEGFPLPKYRGDLWQWGRWAGENHNRARLEVRSQKLVAVHDEAGEFTIFFAPAPGVTLPPVPHGDCDKLPVDKQYACHGELEAAANRTPIDFPVVAVLDQPVLFFIPEHAETPLPVVSAKVDKELWAEVTIPRKGPPRPIQLALKEDGVWKPLGLD